MEMCLPCSHMITGCIFSALLVIHNDLLSNARAPRAVVPSLVMGWGARGAPARTHLLGAR